MWKWSVSWVKKIQFGYFWPTSTTINAIATTIKHFQWKSWLSIKFHALKRYCCKTFRINSWEVQKPTRERKFRPPRPLGMRSFGFFFNKMFHSFYQHINVMYGLFSVPSIPNRMEKFFIWYGFTTCVWDELRIFLVLTIVHLKHISNSFIYYFFFILTRKLREANGRMGHRMENEFWIQNWTNWRQQKKKKDRKGWRF